MSDAQSTDWRVTGVYDMQGRPMRVDVRLSVDTTARAVVRAIERAAASHGVTLERVKQKEEP